MALAIVAVLDRGRIRPPPLPIATGLDAPLGAGTTGAGAKQCDACAISPDPGTPTGLDIESEIDHVAVLNDVVLTFQSQLACLTCCGQIPAQAF